jgi:hypothetical protein
MASRHSHPHNMYPLRLVANSVAEAIALALKENAIAAGKTGADIYRPTIGFAGAMIFAGGVILMVLISILLPANR